MLRYGRSPCHSGWVQVLELLDVQILQRIPVQQCEYVNLLNSHSNTAVRNSFFDSYVFSTQGAEERHGHPKIHEGDVVACTFDATRGTLAYAVNGNDLGVLFSGVSGEVFPAVVFYGNHRSITIKSLRRLDAPVVKPSAPKLEAATDVVTAPSFSARVAGDVMLLGPGVLLAEATAGAPVPVLGGGGKVVTQEKQLSVDTSPTAPVDAVLSSTRTALRTLLARDAASALATALLCALASASLRALHTVLLYPAAAADFLSGAVPSSAADAPGSEGDACSPSQRTRQLLLRAANQVTPTAGLADLPIVEDASALLSQRLASLVKRHVAGELETHEFARYSASSAPIAQAITAAAAAASRAAVCDGVPAVESSSAPSSASTSDVASSIPADVPATLDSLDSAAAVASAPAASEPAAAVASVPPPVLDEAAAAAKAAAEQAAAARAAEEEASREASRIVARADFATRRAALEELSQVVGAEDPDIQVWIYRGCNHRRSRACQSPHIHFYCASMRVRCFTLYSPLVSASEV